MIHSHDTITEDCRVFRMAVNNTTQHIKRADPDGLKAVGFQFVINCSHDSTKLNGSDLTTWDKKCDDGGGGLGMEGN